MDTGIIVKLKLVPAILKEGAPLGQIELELPGMPPVVEETKVSGEDAKEGEGRGELLSGSGSSSSI